MSHFTRIQTKIVDRASLSMAIQDLGFVFEEGNISLSGYGGQSIPVDILIRLPNSYGIGFRFNGDAYEIVTDWYGVRGVNREEFITKLTQRYAYHVTKTKLEEQGFALVEEQTLEDGQVHLLLRRLR